MLRWYKRGLRVLLSYSFRSRIQSTTHSWWPTSRADKCSPLATDSCLEVFELTLKAVIWTDVWTQYPHVLKRVGVAHSLGHHQIPVTVARTVYINTWFTLASYTTQIKSTVDLVRLLQLTTTHYIVQISSISRVTVDSPEEECFQAALESWRGTHQLEFCWQPIPCLRSSDGERPLTEFQTGTGDDIIAVGRSSNSRSRWDISDCSQHTSQVGYGIAVQHSITVYTTRTYRTRFLN